MFQELLQPLPLPAIVVLLGTLATAVAALIIAPFVQLRISKRQIELGNRQAGLTEQHLSLVERQAAGGETAAAASLLAAQNAGIHAVARFRQEWINSLRNDLAKLHSLLTVSRHEPLDNERSTAIAELRTRIELMLNPDEGATEDLMSILDDMLPPIRGNAEELDALFVARSQTILKTEWDRVKRELRGVPRTDQSPTGEVRESKP